MAVIAVVGGTGCVGSNIVKACATDSRHTVRVVSRQSSQTPDWLQQLAQVEVRHADYDSEESLIAALKGADTLRVLSAARKTGATRFAPCDWGFGAPNYSRVDLFSGQPRVWAALRDAVADSKSAARTPFEWAGFHPGLFTNYLAVGSGKPAALAGLRENSTLVWEVARMHATLPLTPSGQVPRIAMTELSDAGRAVSAACALPLGAWEEHMGIIGQVVQLDEVVALIERVRGQEMQVERMPYGIIGRAAANAEDVLQKIYWQLLESIARDSEGECVFEANMNKLLPDVKLQTVEGFLISTWASGEHMQNA